MIVAVDCSDCGLSFTITGRQCHAGLVEPRRRCGSCRRRRRLALQRRWDRLSRIRPESAPAYANAGWERLLTALTTEQTP